MEEKLRTLNEAIYEIDTEYNSAFSMLNDAIFQDKTSIPFVGLDYANKDGLDTAWTIKIEQGKKIGEVMDRVPFGILNKTITGLGATTLEIENQERDSIIVVPTKSLAYNKCISSNAKKGDNYALYIGSPMKSITSNVTETKISAYMNAITGKRKKFLVVTDSLPKLISTLIKLGIDVYNDFFLMVDEIDTLQADSVFRPKLEIVIDYYFKFDRRKRAAVSATLRSFSNPQLKDEAYVTTIWENKPSRNINLIHTNYVDDIAVDIIKKVLEQKTDDKVLIAYNSLDGIANLILSLGESYKDKCGILCSERNQDKVREYLEETDNTINNNGELQKQIVFMTCAYFAGIDIIDKCHLIVISSYLQPYTYLSINRMTQIAGRCRNGNLSETIIYDTPTTFHSSEFATKESYEEFLIKRAQTYATFLNTTRNAAIEDPDLEPLVEFIDSFIDYQTNVKMRNNYSAKIVRQNYISKEFIPAYFNIDAMLEKWELIHSLYANKDNLYNELALDNNVTLSFRYINKEEHESTNINQIKEKNKERREEEIELAITNLNNNTLSEQEIEFRCQHGDRTVGNFYKAYKRLQSYIPKERLLKDLKENYNDQRKLRNYINSAIFWALDEKHSFKLRILAEFDYRTLKDQPKGIRITPTQKRIKLKTIFQTELKLVNLNNDSLSEFFSCFFNTQRGANSTDYIKGLNPKNFPTPLLKITNNENLIHLFLFPNSDL